MMEKVVLAPQRPRKTEEELRAECGSWAAQGKPAARGRNIVTSLELQSEKMEVINKRLQEKYRRLEENEVRYEAIDCDDAEYVIVAFGSSARICSATVEMARAEGLKVGLLRPITLYPFPKKQIAELAARGVKGFLSAELNAGQMVEDVRLAVNGLAPVEHYGRQGGMMFNPDEVLDALKEKLIKSKRRWQRLKSNRRIWFTRNPDSSPITSCTTVRAAATVRCTSSWPRSSTRWALPSTPWAFRP